MTKLMLMFLSLMPCWAMALDATPIHTLPHKLSPVTGLSVSVDQINERWQVTLPNGRVQLLSTSLEGEERGRAAPLLVADFNYDGHPDIAVLAGTGYGGALTTYWRYLWQPKDMRYEKFMSILGNPTLEPRRQTIISWERDGPQWISTEYRLYEGALKRAIVREQNALRWLPQTLDQLTIYPPDSGKVSDSRIIASDTPLDRDPLSITTARNTSDLVKGDRVTMLDYRPSKAGETTELSWLLCALMAKNS